MGFNRPVVVLTRDKDYIKEAQNPYIPKIFYHKYPKFAKTLQNRHLIYNWTRELIDRWEREEKIFVVRPSRVLDIGRMEKNPDELQRIYDIGVDDARNCIEKLKKFLVI